MQGRRYGGRGIRGNNKTANCWVLTYVPGTLLVMSHIWSYLTLVSPDNEYFHFKDGKAAQRVWITNSRTHSLQVSEPGFIPDTPDALDINGPALTFSSFLKKMAFIYFFNVRLFVAVSQGIFLFGTWVLCFHFGASLVTSGKEVLLAQLCLTLCNSMDSVAHQVPLSMGFSR